MQAPRVRVTLRSLVAVVLLVAIAAVLATLERRDRLRHHGAVLKAHTEYETATLARQRAERAVKNYAEETVPRELAALTAEIKQAEDELTRIKNTPYGELNWSERIKAKGYLLLYYDGPSRELLVKHATFTMQHASYRKRVLEDYTKTKILEQLDAQVALAQREELSKRAAYESAQATPAGLFGRLMGRNL